MPKVVVKLTEQVLQIKKSKAVLTVNVSLEATSKGDSALTGTAQPCDIVFFTRASAKATPTELATLSSTVVQAGKLASFDLNAASFKTKLSDKDTDNSVVLTFDKNTFKHPSTGDLTFKLRLPEEAQAFSIKAAGAPADVSVGKFELGASLSIGGQAESAAFTDVAHVHLRHEKVQDDTETDRENLLIGATLAHPTDLRVQGVPFPPTKTRKLPIQSDTLEILLHPSVSGRLDAITGKFDLSVLRTNLQAILGSVFTSMSVELVPSGDPRLTPWTLIGSRLVSSTVKNPDAPLVDEGHLIPFFQFWFFTSRDDGEGELGTAETLAAPKFFFSAATREKRIQRPSDLPIGLDSPFRKEYKAAKSDAARMILLANVVAHEVGHGLGLLHVRKATSGDYELGASIALMSQQISGAEQFSPAVELKRLRPVHEAVLKHHYG